MIQRECQEGLKGQDRSKEKKLAKVVTDENGESSVEAFIEQVATAARQPYISALYNKTKVVSILVLRPANQTALLPYKRNLQTLLTSSSTPSNLSIVGSSQSLLIHASFLDLPPAHWLFATLFIASDLKLSTTFSGSKVAAHQSADQKYLSF